MKENKLTIKFDSSVLKQAFVTFLGTYQSDINRFLQGMLSREGEASDPKMVIDLKKEVVVITTITEDKGIVITVSNKEDLGEDNLVGFKKYSSLAINSVYGTDEKGAISLYIKRKAGQPDDKINVYPDINTAVVNWFTVTQEEVDNVLSQALDEQNALETPLVVTPQIEEKV
jgi:nitrogen regulatory protein PII-like uncharacterized protein